MEEKARRARRARRRVGLIDAFFRMHACSISIISCSKCSSITSSSFRSRFPHYLRKGYITGGCKKKKKFMRGSPLFRRNAVSTVAAVISHSTPGATAVVLQFVVRRPTMAELISYPKCYITGPENPPTCREHLEFSGYPH